MEGFGLRERVVTGCRCLLLSKLVAAPGISVGLGVVGDSAL